MSDPRALIHLSAVGLREAGVIDAADRLDARVRSARAWGQQTPEHVVALSFFGSKRYDELVAIVRAGGEMAA